MFEIEAINRALQEDPSDYLSAEDRRYDRRLFAVCESIAAQLSSHKIIMVSGPSGSGKTTSSLKIEGYLEQMGLNTHTISMDDFFLSRSEAPKKADGSYDFETVHALDLPLFASCFRRLAAGETVGMPTYDFHSGVCKRESYPLRLGEHDLVVVEGIHALNDLVTVSLPQDKVFKIYVSVSSHIYDGGRILVSKRQIRLLRRLVRDFRYRGASADTTFTMWQHVLEGELQFVLPNKCKADVTIDTAFPFDPAVLKRQALPLLRDAARIPLWAEEAESLLCALEKVQPAEEALLPKTALLREFIGGSTYYGKTN